MIRKNYIPSSAAKPPAKPPAKLPVKPIPNPTEQQFFQLWLDFLSTVKSDTKSLDHLLNYFFDRFLESPEKFYRFVLVFEKFLEHSRRDIQVRLADHYLKALSLLCDRAGFFAEKRRLDELCFKIVLPDEYNLILKSVADYRRQSRPIIQLPEICIECMRVQRFWILPTFSTVNSEIMPPVQK